MSPMIAVIKSPCSLLVYAARQLLISVLLLMMTLVSQASAQTTTTNPNSGSTPSGLKPGTPAGSYSLSGFDNVNLYNGNLNFRLPLIGIGGRGGASMQSMLAIDSVRWTVDHTIEHDTGYEFVAANPNWWTGIKVGYGPGVLHGRHVHWRATMTQNFQSLTRLTFTAADGTEYELRDKASNGQPSSTNVFTGARGKIWVSTDGSAMTFISDEPISDNYCPDCEEGGLRYPTGYLFLADGTRYRIGNPNGTAGGSLAGLVTLIRDRNGNLLSFAYDEFKRVTTITDSLNRQVTFTYGNETPLKPKHTYDEISYKGFGGASRSLKIWRTNLKRALRADFPDTLTYYGLFPDLYWSGTTTKFDPQEIAKSVEMPDGRTYELRYNPWGELARVELPTGGAIEYDFTNYPGQVLKQYIHRRVTQRRVYTDATSTTPESRQEYSHTYSSSPNLAEVTVKQYAANTTAMLTHEKHYFTGHPQHSLNITPVGYSVWSDGREYQTEVLSLNETGSPVLRKVNHTWEQSGNTGLSVWWGNGLSNGPGMNPRRLETITTMMDSTPYKVMKQTAINPVTQAVGFDQYNNQTDLWETDYVDEGSSFIWLRHTHTDYLTTNGSKSYHAVEGTDTNPDVAATVHIRRLPKEHVVYPVNPTTGADGSAAAAHTKYFYDQWEIAPRANISGLDASFTAAYIWRGNLTRTSAWRNLPTEAWLNTDLKYDVAGNVVENVDARNNSTYFYYADRFGATNGDVNSYSIPLELDTAPQAQSSYAFVTSVSDAMGHTSYAKYDFYLGVPVDGRDINGVVASAYYTNTQNQTDPLARPFKLVTAVGASAQTQSSFSYNDTARTVTVNSDRQTYGDNLLKSVTLYDGLGRTIETHAYETATSYTTDKKEYDALGRVKRIYNPYRTTTDPTYGWVELTYDALGRVVMAKTSDNAQVSTSYDNHKVTVTDQAGRSRRNIMDALGRLTQVIEDPSGLNYQTSYTYDVLGNLRKVVQGTQSRYFMYDSLSRMLRAVLPEQQANASITPSLTDPITNQSAWSAAYTYDDAGNLETRTDARNLVTTYTYDALNRNTTISYSTTANPPDIINRYDNPSLTYGKGRLWQSERTDSEGTLLTINSFDATGRPLSQSQQFKNNGTWSAAYTSQRSYTITGNPSVETYPSGHTVNYAYDEAGRLNSFSGTLGDGVSRTYSSDITYDEGNRMLEEKYGTQTALYQKLRYNARGQLYDVRLSTLSRAQSLTDWDRGCLALYYSALNQGLGQSSTDNNGNLIKAEVYVPHADSSYNMVQDRYEYDSLNRLQKVEEYQWGAQHIFTQAYTYDRHGNRQIDNAVSTANVNRRQFAINSGNNRLGVPTGETGQMEYDAAGNLTKDTYSRADASRTYDGENRLLTNADSSAQLSRYTYDAVGRRVRRNINNQETWQVYGIGGELVAEYAAHALPGSAQKEYGYRDGELLVTATETGSVQWLITDHLGTPRMIADKTGTLANMKRHDYLPFGEEITINTGGRTIQQGYAADNVRQKFTKYERDDETNLDFAGARYFSSPQGRFTSVDPLMASGMAEEPQTWNRYAYVDNNPLRYIDQDGMQKIDVDFIPRGIDPNFRSDDFESALKGGKAYYFANIVGVIKTSAGSLVRAHYSYDQYNVMDTNCHGLSFANGEFWIEPDDVYPLIRDDYEMVKEGRVEKGDLAVYGDIRNPEHSATVTETKDGKATEVVGINGVERTTVKPTPPKEQPGGKGLQITYIRHKNSSAKERAERADLLKKQGHTKTSNRKERQEKALELLLQSFYLQGRVGCIYGAGYKR